MAPQLNKIWMLAGAVFLGVTSIMLPGFVQTSMSLPKQSQQPSPHPSSRAMHFNLSVSALSHR